MKKINLGLLPRLILGILAGILIGSTGSLFHSEQNIVFITIVRSFTTFTSLFSTFLNFMIPLLILSFVSVGLAELGKKANKLFGITLLIAYLSTVGAGFLSYLLGSSLLPSLIKPIAKKTIESATFEALFTITVDPVFGVMTALILAFVLGLGMANTNQQNLLNCLRDLQQIIYKVLNKVIIPLIPVHIAGLFCEIAASGKLLSTVKVFFKLFLFILIFQWIYILVQFAIASIFRKENAFCKLKNLVPAYFTALGTQSSASTIPVNLDCAKKNGIKSDIADFVIPLGATIHLAGDTICLVIGSMGIMIANGMEPTLAMFTPFIFMLGVTMVAAPGVPGGGVMAALGLISSLLGFTEPMKQLIISLHFSQDSFGTACNVTGDQAIALLVDQIDN
ncbi:proton/glutamate symport protein [Lachnospiraceae bacterium KM106-2]|nr:proton/glutamate symport protein [Lachnospiraceae bacterium KM106-2]